MSDDRWRDTYFSEREAISCLLSAQLHTNYLLEMILLKLGEPK